MTTKRAAIAGAALAIAVGPAGADTKAERDPALRAPLDQLGVVLDGFHVRDGAPDEQMEAVHYCGEVDPTLIQCALFDGVGAGARLIGIEYVITADALANLPAEERQLWHSHVFEVKSGMLHVPGMKPAEELALMEKLAGTYGKTWHTWQHDRGDAMPLGRPDLMLAFTRPGQARKGLTDERDRTFGVKTSELRRQRRDLRAPQIAPGVDRGEDGRSCLGPAPRMR